MSLEQRCFIADVTFLYKVLNGYFNIDFSSFLNFPLWGIFQILTSHSSKDTNSDVQQNACHSHWLITRLYLTLSLLNVICSD